MSDAPALSRNPCWSPMAILLAALSLSIGWGIRGNYGHETGAMFPGALAAIAVCLASGREDWRQRVAYFACLGGLGWGLGGSMTYMQVIAYTQSGHAATQYYGFAALFVIGFLWAAFGVAGTALPAVLDRQRLCELFQPLSVVMGIWLILYFVEVPILRLAQTTFETGFSGVQAAHRHESVLYWMDTDWFSVSLMLIGVLVFDLIDRRYANSLWLPAFLLAGAVIGHLAQLLIMRAGWSEAVGRALVHPQGDVSRFPAERLIANWPLFILELRGYAGLMIGLIVGAGSYFAIFGKFRRGSSLFLHMLLGWYAGFLLLSVLLGWRMTPPRGENWSGLLGAYAGTIIYLLRNGLASVAIASIVGGAVGGLGFSGVALTEALLESFSSQNLADFPGLAAQWTSWQASDSAGYPPAFMAAVPPDARWDVWRSANWHSFLEQSYGFINGIGVIVGMGLLARRVGPTDNSGPRCRWPEVVAVTFTIPVLLYVNMVKNVGDWTSGEGVAAAVPKAMQMPLTGFTMSTWAWFNCLYGVAAIAFVMLLSIHGRRRLAILEQSWLGRGQLLFLVLLWTFVLGNVSKAIVHFHEQRLLTEGVTVFNAVLVTMLILLVPRSEDEPTVAGEPRMSRLLSIAAVGAILCAAIAPPLEAYVLRSVYGDAVGVRAGSNGIEARFGPKATWKLRPLLKGKDHR